MRKSLLDLQAKYKTNWDGCGAQQPNELALQRADIALDIIEQYGFKKPTKLMPSVESGIGVTWSDKDGRYADIEFFNNGDMCIAMFMNNEEVLIEGVVPPGTHPTKGDLLASLQKIQNFLSGQPVESTLQAQSI